MAGPALSVRVRGAVETSRGAVLGLSTEVIVARPSSIGREGLSQTNLSRTRKLLSVRSLSLIGTSPPAAESHGRAVKRVGQAGTAGPSSTVFNFALGENS